MEAQATYGIFLFLKRTADQYCVSPALVRHFQIIESV